MTISLWHLPFIREFQEDGNPLAYEKNQFEKSGEVLSYGAIKSADFVLREISNPVFVIFVTNIALVIASTVFYPEKTVDIINQVCPILWYVKPWMFKMTLYVAAQATVLGIGMRTLGQIRNPAFMTKLQENSLTPIYLGNR